MAIGVIMFLAWMALEVVYVAGMIAWGFETGQFKDIEEPKYRMLLDVEPQPWPGRKPALAVARSLSKELSQEPPALAKSDSTETPK